jgi:hypothetical protein
MATNRRFDELDDRTVEELLAGRLPGERADLQVLALFVTSMRSLPATEPAVVRPELAAIFDTGLASGNGDVSPATTDHPIPHTSRRRRMLETLSAFLVTLTGKVVLGTAAVAASVGGAHAAGAVDVPGLPDRAPAVVEAPAVEDAAEQSDNRPEVESGQPEAPGVDGTSVSERATDGEPQEDGKAFGTSVAEEAVEGTPAEGLPADRGEAGQDRQPGTPAGSAETADEYKPDDTPDGNADTADEYKPDSTPTGRP